MEEHAQTGLNPEKRQLKRLHRERCGVGRFEYDSYDDVREACERKLKKWEREGIIVPGSARQAKDRLFV